MSIAKIIEFECRITKEFRRCSSERDHPGIQDRAQHQIGLGEGQHVVIENGKVALYRVDLKVTFVLD